MIIANLILLLGYFNWSVYKKEQTLENIPDWWAGAFELAPVAKAGELKLLDIPGLGIKLNHDYINAYNYQR